MKTEKGRQGGGASRAGCGCESVEEAVVVVEEVEDELEVEVDEENLSKRTPPTPSTPQHTRRGAGYNKDKRATFFFFGHTKQPSKYLFLTTTPLFSYPR